MAPAEGPIRNQGQIRRHAALILGTVGTHTASFDRLIRALDDLADIIEEQVVVQIGASRYMPQHAAFFESIAPDEFRQLMRSARIVVTHGGDTILEAIGLGIPTVVVPRRHAHREHIDDHQVHLAEALSKRGLVTWCEPDELTSVVMAGVPPMSAKIIGHGSRRQRLVDAIRDAIGPWDRPLSTLREDR